MRLSKYFWLTRLKLDNCQKINDKILLDLIEEANEVDEQFNPKHYKKELEQNHGKLSWTMTEHSNDQHTCNVKSCATEQ